MDYEDNEIETDQQTDEYHPVLGSQSINNENPHFDLEESINYYKEKFDLSDDMVEKKIEDYFKNLKDE